MIYQFQEPALDLAVLLMRPLPDLNYHPLKEMASPGLEEVDR